MWDLVELGADHSGWTILDQHKTNTVLAEELTKSGNIRIVVPSKLSDYDHETQHRLIGEALTLNAGRIRRVMGGVRVERIPGLAAACPNDCYCLVESDGTQFCEVIYCDGSHCWPVRCNASC